MTTKPQPTKSAPAESPPEPAPPRPRSKGDVHVGTMGSDVRQVPGSGTEEGDKAIANVMRDVLERVRRSIRERNSRTRESRTTPRPATPRPAPQRPR